MIGLDPEVIEHLRFKEYLNNLVDEGYFVAVSQPDEVIEIHWDRDPELIENADINAII